MEPEKRTSNWKKITGLFTRLRKGKQTFGIWPNQEESFLPDNKITKEEIAGKLLELIEVAKKSFDGQNTPNWLGGSGSGNGVGVAEASIQQAASHLYDFYNGVFNRDGINRLTSSGIVPYAGQMSLSHGSGRDSAGDLTILAVNEISTSSDESNPPKRRKVMPKDVLPELYELAQYVKMDLLDEKIALIEKKLSLTVSNHYSRSEMEAMIERLKNRKMFTGDIEVFFSGFKATTDEKITELLAKYDLVIKTSDLFIAEFPEEAINIMAKYTEHCQTLCNKKPVFYVIATSDYFQVKFAQRDPILLAQSPFGFYWDILGAWDKELVFLPEL